MLCNLRSKFNLEKILPTTIYKKMLPNALLIWQKNIYDCKKSGVTDHQVLVVHETTSELKYAILTILLFAGAKKPTLGDGRTWCWHPLHIKNSSETTDGRWFRQEK
jgi:hypothetical protein